MKRYDVGIIGGGIIGTSAAAFLADQGRSVVLVEREGIGAGASGRNSGVIQHPFDPFFGTLFDESLPLYRELERGDDDFSLPTEPAGLLMLSEDGDAVRDAARSVQAEAPDLTPTVLEPHELARLEPGLAAGLWACRLETGYPVGPATATNAWARRAARAGVDVRISGEASVELRDATVTAIRVGGDSIPCEQVLVAAGPWTPALVPGWAASPPITELWGVVASVTLPSPPRHVVEELGISGSGHMDQRMFSLVTAGPTSSVGSTFLPVKPDPGSIAPELLNRGARFVPVLAAATIESVRACARPLSFDGRPLIGAVNGYTGLFVCAGHGPWGISTGPGSALLIARLMLGLAEIRPEFDPRRV